MQPSFVLIILVSSASQVILFFSKSSSLAFCILSLYKVSDENLEGNRIIWDKKQRLADQTRLIRTNGWLSEVELNEI